MLYWKCPYYSKVSLEQSLAENVSSGNGQNLKNKKLHKIWYNKIMTKPKEKTIFRKMIEAVGDGSTEQLNVLII